MRNKTTLTQPSLSKLTALFVLTLLSQIAYPIYSALIAGQDYTAILLPSFLFVALLTIPSLYTGAKLAPFVRVGFVNANSNFKKGTAFAIITSLPLAGLLLLLRWLLQPYLPAELPDYGFRGVTGGLLVTMGAAIAEEVWFRYALLTLCLYTYLKVSKKQTLDSLSALVLISLIAALFGLAHIPQLLSFGAASTFAIVCTILGNIAVGVLYGWCFWRHGLVAAIVAHFTVDIVLHVIPAIYSLTPL